MKFLRRLFAARQIYVRNGGNVTFVQLSSRSLVVLSVLMLLLAGWTGIASVNMLFKEQMAEQRERDLRKMQLSYENELNRLRLAYDDLNTQVALTQDWFSETTSRLEKRHNALTKVMEHRASVSSDLHTMQKSFAALATKSKKSSSKTSLVGRKENAFHAAFESRQVEPGTTNRKIELTQLTPSPVPLAKVTRNITHLPDALYRRVSVLETQQDDLLNALEESVDLKIAEFEELIDGINVVDRENFMARALPQNAAATGGPYIPLKGESNRQSDLNRQIYRISSNLERLSGLSQSLVNLPVSTPIHNYRLTSGFGPRMDPFRRRPAFHSGVDFGTRSGTPVHATLAGVVRRASYNGPYGLVVEIDHGNGFRTLYGHLARRRVRVGQRVEFQQHIGDAGNSGRSTGPHLHYEIWYDGEVRNPMNFLDAGKQLFNIANIPTDKKQQ